MASDSPPSHVAPGENGTDKNRCPCDFCTPWGCRCCSEVKRPGFKGRRERSLPAPDTAHLADVHDALDESGAPIESAGVDLAASGRVRALNLRLLTGQNRQREAAWAAADALRHVLALKERLPADLIERCKRALALVDDRAKE